MIGVFMFSMNTCISFRWISIYICEFKMVWCESQTFRFEKNVSMVSEDWYLYRQELIWKGKISWNIQRKIRKKLKKGEKGINGGEIRVC